MNRHGLVAHPIRTQFRTMPSSEILCVGEVLWDALPEGLFLGGAPFNVACHLRAAGTPVSMVSRVGHDRLGEEALRRAARYGVGIDLVQVDDTLPTGFVSVTVDDAGIPAYEIVAPAAWDAITASDTLLARAAEARAIVFGSLAQRNATSRRTVERLLDLEALKVFDVNLRPPFEDREVVRRSLQQADVVKLSDTEMRQVADWFDLRGGPRDTAARLAESFGCSVVCITRGSNGAALWRDGTWSEHPGFTVEVKDTVGAGDAFLAVLLVGLLGGGDTGMLLQNANLIGAYVATQFGALPTDQAAAIPSVPAPPIAKRPRRSRRA
jgi:fructokinase